MPLLEFKRLAEFQAVKRRHIIISLPVCCFWIHTSCCEQINELCSERLGAERAVDIRLFTYT